jgi:hypothetical protein
MMGPVHLTRKPTLRLGNVTHVNGLAAMLHEQLPRCVKKNPSWAKTVTHDC